MKQNTEEKISKIMELFPEIEKQLLEMFIASDEGHNKIKLIHPFYFERMMSYFQRKIPEQAGSVYPLFLVDLEKVPQFMQAVQSFVITVVKKAKEDGLKEVDVDYARNCAITGGFLPEHVDEMLKKDSLFNWGQVIEETQLVVDELLESASELGKQIISDGEIVDFKKEFENKSENEMMDYLGNSKILFGFFTYMNEVVGRKEFFDYIGDNIMGEVILKEYNVEYAQKIVAQINYFLSKR